jgi:hypothetical protein
MRRLGIVALGILPASIARAQSCHVTAPTAEDERGLRLVARADTAGFDTERDEGHYQGLFLGVRFAYDIVSVSSSLPVYRIVDDGVPNTGIGDVPLAARIRLATFDEDRLRLGAGLSTTLPSGDPDKELGMGHVMLMPVVFGSRRFGRFELGAELAYAQALGSPEAPAHQHHHHEPDAPDGTSPLVDPMNRSELMPLLAARFDLGAPWTVRGGAYGGFPVGSLEGTARAIAFVGVDVSVGRFGTRIQGEMPFAGDPFTGKLVLELSTRL